MELGSCKRNGCSWKIACWSLNCSRIQWIHATHMLMILPMFINVLLYVPGVIDIPTYYILLWYIFCFCAFFSQTLAKHKPWHPCSASHGWSCWPGMCFGRTCASGRFFSSTILPYPSLSETNRWHLKVDGWKMILSFFGFQHIFKGYVAFREGIPLKGSKRGVCNACTPSMQLFQLRFCGE